MLLLVKALIRDDLCNCKQKRGNELKLIWGSSELGEEKLK